MLLLFAFGAFLALLPIIITFKIWRRYARWITIQPHGQRAELTKASHGAGMLALSGLLVSVVQGQGGRGPFIPGGDAVSSRCDNREARQMPNALELPAPIRDELVAAHARRVAEFDGPKGQQSQLWIGRARLVLAELWPDGSVEIWRQLDDSNSMAATSRAMIIL